jgi:hypothetical protein
MNAALIDTLKAWALANYENGGDVMVECWGANEWAAHVAEHGANSLPALADLATLLNSYSSDIRAY